MVPFHGVPHKIESHHKKAAFLGVRIPLESWRNVWNSEFGKRFCASGWNSRCEKREIAI